jgi:3-oxoacyl-[acyl-carrier protein] reductase
MGLKGKIALVTGASRGIGRAVVVEFARRGAKVVAVARNADLLKALADELNADPAVQAAGGSVEFETADVTDGERVRKLVDGVAERLTRIDVLVNNAGITRDTLFLRMEDADWDAVITGNLRSVFLMTKAVAQHMLRTRWGRIINIGSVVGLHGNKGQANYAASKAGLVGFTKSVAQELAKRKITANVIAPGFITTDMTGVLPDEVKKAVLAKIPSERMGEPRDVAAAAAFLADDAAGYITGVVLPVDGGMAM